MYSDVMLNVGRTDRSEPHALVQNVDVIFLYTRGLTLDRVAEEHMRRTCSHTGTYTEHSHRPGHIHKLLNNYSTQLHISNTDYFIRKASAVRPF